MHVNRCWLASTVGFFAVTLLAEAVGTAWNSASSTFEGELAGERGDILDVLNHSLFTGSYICIQGSTGLALHIDSWPLGRFKFFPTPKSPHNCSGEFRVRGEWVDETKTLSFHPLTDSWIHNKCGYMTVGLRGTLAKHGLRFQGEITTVLGCSVFSTVRGGASNTVCFDSDNGVTDNRGSSCSTYYFDDEFCGGEDNDDFAAAALCCACGGGIRGGLATSACFDWNDTIADHRGFTCRRYTEHPEECGYHNSPKFVAHNLCCKCGGGVQAVGAGLRHELQDYSNCQLDRDKIISTAAQSEKNASELLELSHSVARLEIEKRDLQGILSTVYAQKHQLHDRLAMSGLEALRLGKLIQASRKKNHELQLAYWRLHLLLCGVAGLLVVLLISIFTIILMRGRVQRGFYRGGCAQARDINPLEGSAREAEEKDQHQKQQLVLHEMQLGSEDVTT